MASCSVATDALNSFQLLITSSEILLGAARILRASEKDAELKIFYADFTAHCAIMNSHWQRISMMAYEIDVDIVHRTLDHLESAIVPDVLDAYKLNHGALSRAPRFEKLRAFNRSWERVQKRSDNIATLQYIRSRMSFGANEEELDQFIQMLTVFEKELQARYPENQSERTHEELSIGESFQSSSFAMWNAAQSIFEALVACSNCDCTPTHEAQLRLGTYRKPKLDKEGEMDDYLDLDMFLSMKQSWHEARVLMVKEIQESVIQIQKRAIKINQVRVRQLCEKIAKAKNAEYRLELKVMGGQLFKLRSERRSTLLVDRTRSPVTLDQFLRNGSHPFTERTKRILAVMLSYTVLYLHDTPWLQPTWSSSHVLFLPTASSSIPLRPFIQIHLASRYNSSRNSCVNPEDFDPDELDPDDFLVHHCPLLITLAVMLMELFFAAPFDILAKQYGVSLASDIHSPMSTLRYLDVNLVFEKCRSEIPESYQFHRVIEKCLDPETWEDENNNKLDTEALISKIYQEVVKPLETELSQAYSSISTPPIIKIAILDTGIDIQHPDIDARLENIQDRYNWLLDDNSTNRRVVFDQSGHGTFAASLILDYAPDAQLYVAKIADTTPSEAGVIAKAINHAVSVWEVDIISMSFGFPTCAIENYSELESALANAHAKRVLLFAAASNSGGTLGRAYPARDQNVIAIHATDTNGNRSSFSPTAVAHDINLATVGEAIQSAWPMHLWDASNGNFLKYKSGTSFATPIATGIAAFLLLYAKIHIPEKADALKSRRRMQALLRHIAEKEAGQTARDGYHFIDLSLYADSLFGKSKDFIDGTIRDVLST
ncbi:peptidase S8/S53 domain-containing protein [Trichoderma chlorosporum]